MTNRKNTRRALVLSILSLLVCCSMLVGTTFAWFTDSVQTGNNKIIAGNLDVELYNDLQIVDTKKVDQNTPLFEEITLWEPGVVAYENLTVANVGTLALKYELKILFGNENTVDGYGLSQILKVGVVKGGIKDNATREEAVAAVENWLPMQSFSWNGKLEANTTAEPVALVIYWEPTAEDNNWNVNNGKQVSDFTETKKNELHIDLGIDLFATQLVSESDSFGSDYDSGAAWTGAINTDWYFEDPDAQTFVVDTAEELAGFAAIVNGTAAAPVTTFAAEAPTTVHDDFKGHTVVLGANVDLRDAAWTPIGRIGTTSTDFTYAFKGTFDGGNYTISNLNVSNEGWAGLFGLAHGATIQNVKLNGVTINSNRMAGSVVGQLYGSIDNCHVTDASIRVIPNAVGSSYDNGDKVGGIVGWIGDNGNNRTLTGCSVTDADIGAYRDVGGIAGYVATTTTVSGNKVTGTSSITVDQTTNFYGEKTPNAGEIVGRKAGDNVTVENNTVGEEVAVQETYMKDGIVLREGTEYTGVTLYKIPADYPETTVNVPEGVTAVGGYAFAYNSNVEKIVLPSTVTTLNDRAFRDTSASEVVLNEGLENISYQAFRNASNVKSVVIPSTVTTISKEAFQNSGVETLTIPANVTTIEYGGLRDMKKLVSVTIEGNVNIPVYAFRACTELRTVILKGNDVTFGAGTRGMIFTNKENGDGTAITVYVANDTVKERLLAADTAAKDYGGYKIEIITTEVSDAGELAAAFASGGQIKLTDDIVLSDAVEIKADTVIDLNGKVLSTQAQTLLKISSGNVTLKNGTIRNVKPAATETQYSIYMSGDAVAAIENVQIETSGVGIQLTDNAKITKLDAEVSSVMNANGYCCFDAVSLTGNSRIEKITGGTYESKYTDEYIAGWAVDHKYSGIESWPINLNGDGASIGEISGGTFLGVMDKANNGTPIHVNNGKVELISGGYFGFSKMSLAAPDIMLFTGANGSIEKITGGKFEKGDWKGFGCDFAGIVDASGCKVQATGETVEVKVQFSTRVATYTLEVVEVISN